MTGRTYTAAEGDAWRDWYDRLDGVSSYHSHEYLTHLTGGFEYETEDAELFVYGDEDGFVYYPYIRRSLSDLAFADDAVADSSAYSDIVSSWYYGGPILSPGADAALADEFVDAFGAHCREAGIVAEFVRFDPNLENHEQFDALDPTYNRDTVYVDLTKPEQAIRDEMEKRCRNALHQAEQTHLVVEPTSDPADYEAFYEIYTNAMEAKDAARHYRFSYEFFAELFEKEICTLTVPRYEGTVVGGHVIVHDGTVAHDYLRATDPDYWDMRVNNLLCYESMMAMRERGIERFDLQGGRPGVFKFKKSFSPDRGEFYIAKRTHVDEVYEKLTDAASESGLDTDTGYFPAYRVELSN